MEQPIILIVEDNLLTSTLLSTVFKELGFDVREVSYGSDVLPYLEKNKVHLLILDLELPGMSGDEIYAAIRKDPRFMTVPIVPFTAHGDKQSPSTYVFNLMKTEIESLGSLPTVVYKSDELGDAKNVTNELIDKVTMLLLKNQINLPNELERYYKTTRQINPAELRNLIR